MDKKDEVKFLRSYLLPSERSPVEDGPGADGKDEQFEREGDEKAIALNLTTINFDAKTD